MRRCTKAEEVERLGFALTPIGSAFCRVATELGQPGFLRVQFQRELAEPIPEFAETWFRVRAMWNGDEITRVTHGDRGDCRVALSPVLNPQVKHAVQGHASK
jgi:hypothetical protein